MKQDYLSQALPPSAPPVGADQLPSGDKMREAVVGAEGIHDSLDMISLSPAERTKVGPASTPAEMEQSRLFAELTDACPQLLTLLGRAPGSMRAGYEMERLLLAYRQANLGLLKVGRGAFIISAADLTGQNDRVEEAAVTLSVNPSLSPERRAVIGNAGKCLDELRQTQKDAQAQRRKREERRQKRQQTEVQKAQARETQVRRLAQLASAPLPDGSAKK